MANPSQIESIFRRTLEAFRRSSSAISLVIALGLLVMTLSTGYHIFAYESSEFLERPGAQEYENAVENVTQMNEWARTKFYWSNNLRVAGFYILWTPIYSGFHSLTFNEYAIGMNLAYWYHAYGAETFLVFLSGVFFHGVLELTGIFIVVAITLRVAWNFWKGISHMMTTGTSKKWSWGLSKGEKREILKHKCKIKELLVDFLVLASFGAFLIFLAAPIEAYISPSIMATFRGALPLAVVFLIGIASLYFSIFVWGLEAMKKDIRTVYGDVKLAFKRKWRPTQLSLLMFMVFFFIMVLSLSFLGA